MDKFSTLIIWYVFATSTSNADEESIAPPRNMNKNEISLITWMVVIDYGQVLLEMLKCLFFFLPIPYSSLYTVLRVR